MSTLPPQASPTQPFVRVLGWRMSRWHRAAGIGAIAWAVTWMLLVTISGWGPAVGAACLMATAAVYRVMRRRGGELRSVAQLHCVLPATAATAALLSLGAAPLASGLDAWTASSCLGLAIGRIGCHQAGCCYGREATRAIASRRSTRTGRTRTSNRLPVQLVEAGVLFMLSVTGLVAIVRDIAEPGSVAIGYLFFYGAFRFTIEFFRGDVRPHIGALSEAQVTSAGMVVAAAAIAYLRYAPTQDTLVPALSVAALVGVIAIGCERGRSRLGRPDSRSSTEAAETESRPVLSPGTDATGGSGQAEH